MTKLKFITLVIATSAFLSPVFGATPATTLPLTPTVVNDAGLVTPVGAKMKGAAVLRAQILLERTRFSPGEIDAAYGSNMRTANAGFQKKNSLTISGTIDAPTWAVLNRDTAPVLVTYRLAAADVAGPFARIPTDMMEKSKMAALGYVSPAEALGEKFHTSPKLLAQLNPGKDLGRVEQDIVVPNIEPTTPMAAAATIVVDRSASTVSLRDAAGTTIAQYPASTGSEHDPLPVGNWKVNGVAKDPTFNYNPDLFWDADPAHAKAKIPAGPNNPVGVVWIDLSKPHYGIHGTPEPSKIGKTESHGCIRMTNWSALTLSQAVSPGTPAVLQE